LNDAVPYVIWVLGTAYGHRDGAMDTTAVIVCGSVAWLIRHSTRFTCRSGE
jgi:hypothetical protein